MKHEIHLNKEYITGFVEALFCEFENSLGPFKSDLVDYEINIYDELENTGKWRIVIPYAIIGDERADLCVYFDLAKNSILDAFRIKVEVGVEEIIRHIRTFNANHC